MSFRFNQSDFSLEFKTLPPSTSDTRSVINCFATHGGTVVLCSVVLGEWEGFGECLPLSVRYSERLYSINKVPTGFTKRENKNKDNDVLIGRLIDRSLRPTIEDSFRFRTQVNLTVLSYSANCPVEPLCITAASACLVVAGVPANQICGIKLSNSENGWDFGTGNHSVVISGNPYGLATIETSGAPLHPNKLLEAIHFSLPQINTLYEYVRHATNKVKKLHHAPVPFETQSLNVNGKSVLDAYQNNDLQHLNKQANDFISKWSDKGIAKFKWQKLTRSILRSNILWSNKRLDNRSMDEVRNLVVQKNPLPINGSYMLARGRTRVLLVPTCSNNNEFQTFEALDGNESRKFILQYNYLLGDDKVSRRDVGHGNLARNAIKFAVNTDKFIRLVSEVIESDGSSSMTTVTAASMCLKSMGIISQMVSGISVGLIMEGFTSRFMVDLTALEDSISDMDLKIAGTKDGITAVQIDLKIPLLTWGTFENAIHYGFDQLVKILNNLDPEEPIIINQPVSKEVKKHEGKKPSSHRNEHRIVFHLSNELVSTVNSNNLIENVKKEIPVDLVCKNKTFIFSGKNSNVAVNKFLTLLYNIGKEMCYALVESIVGLEVGVSLANGKAHTVKLSETNDQLKEGMQVCVYKGKFGRWVLHSILN